jgi:hypothetical protein
VDLGGCSMNIYEAFACLVHKVWARWIKYLFSKCVKNNDGTLTIPSDLVLKWKRQSLTRYCDLEKAETDSDRKLADEYLSLLSVYIENGDVYTKGDVVN